MTPRLGLSESLEAYAKRNGVTRERARPWWRAYGAIALGSLRVALQDCHGICRVAINFSCPTRNPFETGWP